ncbi:PREDICTED: GDP-fucose transporter 1 [Nicrophorus vespilloides]|uniref:GDP-fucose transporter 1 n=1 Tax=Nicrophorus vespilloides TaxID=110193 RepID=A0ABM1MB91_NICVS|nr:PREDICTED: GDP-fucose transporter 1 [Nicrophorus vespilloides]
MSSTQHETLLRKYIRIFLVVSGYWVISILTVFVNKTLLSDLNLEAPFFIAFYQTVVTALICLFMLNRFKQSSHEVKPFDSQTMRNVIPLAVMFTSMIATNNLCLKYVSVAFYYIGRSLTTIFNVAFTYLILGDKTSKRCIFFCFLIIFGFYLGVDQENLAGSLSISGTIFGILGSLSLSLYSIFTKRVLPKVDENIWVLSCYNNIYSSIIFIPLMLLNGDITEVLQYDRLFDPFFWILMTVGGVCGFSIGFLTTLQIKVTSALTHNISGTAKACAQTVLATYWYDEVKSMLWWFSNMIVLLGSAGYARVKQLDMEKKHRQSAAYTKV